MAATRRSADWAEPAGGPELSATAREQSSARRTMRSGYAIPAGRGSGDRVTARRGCVGRVGRLRRQRGLVRGDGARDGGLVPAQLARDEVGDVRRGGGDGVAVERPGAGATVEDVVERACHLVAEGVHGLRSEVRKAGDERLSE